MLRVVSYDEMKVSADRGFLPPRDPLDHLPPAAFAWLDDFGAVLPDLFQSGSVRRALDSVNPVSVSDLKYQEIDRARMIYSFLASAYVHASGEKVATSIPKGIARPLWELSRTLGRPPIMSYADYVLGNWKRIDASRSIELGNLELLQRFSGTPDESWFILTHVEIEAEAGPALAAIPEIQKAVCAERLIDVISGLETVEKSLKRMNETLKRMSEGCSPDVYYHAVRPYLFGFKDVYFEGVDELRGMWFSMRGGSGAQSSIVPAIVAALGIKHAESALTKHVAAMRYYMPPEHDQVISGVEQGPSIRKYVLQWYKKLSLLGEAYNAALLALRDFRVQHFEWARVYVHERVKNPEGSGGTEFMPWLKLLIDETEQYLLR